MGALNGTPAVYHGGADFSALSMLILLPESRSGVILLSNASGFVQLPQVEGIARSVVDMLNGKPGTPISPPFHYLSLYWTIVLMPLLQILGIAYSWRYSWQHSQNKGIGHILLIVILYSTVGLLLLFGVPQLIGMSLWDGIRISFPDLGYGLIVGAALGIGWSIIYTAMSLRARNSK